MRKIIIFLLLLCGVAWYYMDESIHERHSRWKNEMEECYTLDRLYEIKDSMDYFREQIEDDLYKRIQDKIGKLEIDELQNSST